MLTYSILVTAEPAEEPITTAEAKSQARIDIADDDTLVASFIVAARLEAESWLGRRLVTQTIDTFFDCWPHVAYYTGTRQAIHLPGGPAQSITHIKYYDADGTLTTWDAASYYTDLNGLSPRIALASGYSYPTLQTNRPAAIQVRSVVGYGAASAVPAGIKTAIAMRVADLYEHREARLDANMNAADNPTWVAIMSPYRIIDYRLGG
jgi:uncharacterized phiE125 gp8 family phage protein